MREEWKVPYTGAKLLAAAQEKRAFHEGRKTWWEEKKKELMEELKKDGITISESVVDELAKIGYHTMSNSGRGGGPDIQLDPELVAKIRESSQKVHEHTGKIAGYDSWVQMLTGHTMKDFDVDNADWVYFFGK